jgi:hypothetical protein
MTLVTITDLVSAVSNARTVPAGSTFPHGFTERWTFIVAVAAVASLSWLIATKGLSLRRQSPQLG